jgi:glucosamine-6-phosphate deaminase
MSLPIKCFRVDDLQVRTYGSEIEMAWDAGKIAREYLVECLQQRDKIALLLATGKSQLQFLNNLISLGGIDWSRVIIFHLDEYLGINPENPASFRYYLTENVEKRVLAQQFEYIEGNALEPIVECERYGKLLTNQPIDLCLLGVGENGHLAFNDPDVANFGDLAPVKLVKLDEINRQQQVKTGYFANLESVPQYAFTVTIPMICKAKKIMCLAPQTRKAKIVKELLYGDISPKCPASILRHQPQASLFLDLNSAKEIPFESPIT